MRLAVRRLEQEDLPVRVDWFNNPEINRTMTLEVPVSLQATQQWFQHAVSDKQRRDFVFVMADTPEERVSMGGLVDIDFLNSRAELYMLVSPSRQGQGIGKATLRWLCNYGFNTFNLNRIYLTTMEFNTRAQNLYSKHGFVVEGRLRQHLLHQGRFVDRYVHGLLRSEWVNQSWAIVDKPIPLEVTTTK